MVDLLGLKRNALSLGLCGEYKDLWNNCKSKKELVNLALDANGIEFMADSIAFGWGLSAEYLQREFSEYANENYTAIERGYTSKMFLNVNNGKIKPCSTLSLIVGCNCTIELSEGFVGKIYVCGGSDVNIVECVESECELYVYGLDNKVSVIKNDAGINRTDVQTSQWRTA